MWMFKTKENGRYELKEIQEKTYISVIEEGISSLCSVFIFDVESIYK